MLFGNVVLVLVPLAAGSYLLGDRFFEVFVVRRWEVHANACGRCRIALLFGLDWISAVVVIEIGLLYFTAF